MIEVNKIYNEDCIGEKGSRNMSKKCYVFKAAILCDGEGYIYAADVEEAKRLIMNKDWDDLDNLSISEVIEVTELREDK